MVKKILLMAITVSVALALFVYASRASGSRGKLVFSENLSETAVTIDGEIITLEDLKFYVLFQENKVEEQAKVYNPDNTKDYWNAHTNGSFISLEAKEAIMGMAIHDRIMYNLARENHVVLGEKEKNSLEEARTQFWADIYEEQLEKLPLSFEDGNRTILEIAIAEAYQDRLALELDTTFAGLAWDGYDFEQILKEHDVKINDEIWDRISVGEISLTHDRVNYINGLSDAELEELRERKKK